MQLKPNSLLQGGKYRIERVLGQGGFGITYLAATKFTTQGELGSMEVEAHVAIKEFFMSEINSRKSDDSRVEGSSGTVFSNYRRKFKTEAQNLAKLAHPNIVKVYDVFDENNTTYYVMEFIDGQDLDHYIRQCGHIPEKEAVGIVGEIGKALGYMHSQKMLHLDMKPKNVMRRRDGRCCLIDFGLSKQFDEKGEPESSTTIGLGTPGYAPLEQSQYKQDGTFPATLDVYALGSTLYKMLSGERPPMASDVLNLGFPAGKLRVANVSEKTVSAVKKAMNPIRVERYQTVGALLKDLPAYTANDDEKTEIKRDDEKRPTVKRYAWQERHWLANLALGGMCAYLVCLGIVSFDWGYMFESPENRWMEWYMVVALGVSLHFSILLLQGQKCRWYIPLIVNLHPVAAVFITLPYGVALLSLFIKRNGLSGWKMLDKDRLDKCRLWNKERHFVVNAMVVFVTGITLLLLLGTGLDLDRGYSHYDYDMVFSLVMLSLYGLYLLLRNAVCWAMLVAGGLILTLVSEEIAGHNDHFPVFLLFCLYALLAAALLIRKNGKSAWSLMK